MGGGCEGGVEECVEGPAGAEGAGGCVLDGGLEGEVEMVEELGYCGGVTAAVCDAVLPARDDAPFYGGGGFDD